MIKPDFLKEKKLSKQFLLKSDLEIILNRFGVKILPYGIIDKNTDYIKFLSENVDFDQIITYINFFLEKKDRDNWIEIFWSNSQKFSLKCQIDFCLDHLYEIVMEDWDFWIISDNWIIEYYHEGILSYFEK